MSTQLLTIRCTSTGEIEPIGRSPMAGRMCKRSMLASRAMVEGFLAGLHSCHSAATSRNLVAVRLGSIQLPRARSAFSVAWNCSASLRVRNVREYSRPLVSRSRTS
ncbi:hypothetical protein K6U06_22190 [Acidiferrimicrobium sp. IK]|uniref:hypothetical protein n=1 Tax=Acidiferrimicrobium sp. IK TaxID=2871700 RepID=UPI0021CB1B85|nr:hypothetical protein [Acidiferrimicrobium sp. IK]MCU4187090.1 hypothetical protein [Acidiferrimicrobium sp. IK]